VSRHAEILGQVLLEGDALLHERRFAEGEERARAVLAQQPRNPGGHYLMGLSALMQERHAEALEHVERAIKLDRVNPQYHFMAALCLAPLQRLDEAITSYRRALQFRPEFIEARSNLGYLLECAGKGEEAVECYRKVLAGNPDEWFCLNRLGFCERILGRPGAALAPLARAIELEPRSAPTHNELALALQQLGRTADAIASLRNAVAVDPAFAAGWANLCKLLYLEHLAAVQAAAAAGSPLPDPAPVVECFDRLLEFDPANAEFRYLRDGLAGVRVERPPDAYIEAFFDRFAPRFEARLLGELGYSAPGVVARFLAPWLSGRSGLRVADLGCGTGLSGALARPHAGALTGIDLSSAMLEIARQRGLYDELAREEVGDWLVRQSPQSLDLLLALDVFIYVGALDRVMAAVAAALAPDGRFVFTIEELAPPADFKLLPDGRYAHAPDYVAAAARSAGLREVQSEPFDIRNEAGRPVRARVYALEKG
jgi:predicted TPR repeat methyltransferase